MEGQCGVRRESTVALGNLELRRGMDSRIGCTLVDASQGKEAGARNRSPDLLVRLFVLLEA